MRKGRKVRDECTVGNSPEGLVEYRLTSDWVVKDKRDGTRSKTETLSLTVDCNP